MSLHRFHQSMLTTVALVAGAGLASCALPPVNTGEQNVTVPYSVFVPGIVQGVPVVTGVPAFADQKAPPTTVPVPREAKTFTIASLTLNLHAQNTGPIPLRVKLFLSQDGVDPYTTTPLGGDDAIIELPRGGGEARKTFSVDPSLLSADNLKLGYTFGSPGTSESVTFQESDKVSVTYSITAQAKLF